MTKGMGGCEGGWGGSYASFIIITIIIISFYLFLMSVMGEGERGEALHHTCLTHK